jgi:hypothetical protein
MTHTEIRAAILANGWQSLPPGEIAVLLNTPRTVLAERMIGVGAVLKYLGPINGATLLDQINALKETDATVRWGWYLLERGELDVALDSTRAMLDKLLPAEAAAVLKALAEQTVTAGLDWQQVRDALEGI